MANQKLENLELYAWVGEDEFGSGDIGLKQALCPAGMIPLVAVKQGKMEQDYIEKQMQRQAKTWGKRIRLVRFKFAGVVKETEYGTDGQIQ